MKHIAAGRCAEGVLVGTTMAPSQPASWRRRWLYFQSDACPHGHRRSSSQSILLVAREYSRSLRCAG